MALNFLTLALLSLAVSTVAAAPSAEELALRNAILSPVEDADGETINTVFLLTKNIVLTSDLPPLPNGKLLTVQSAPTSGAPFTIDGAKKYLIFHNTVGDYREARLSLRNLILTRSKFAAVDLVGADDEESLLVNNVRFVNNPCAMNLRYARGSVNNSRFSGSTKSAVVITSEVDGPNDNVDFINCIFSDNKADKGKGGGAIRAIDFGSFTASSCTFSKNSADTYGGAIFLDTSTPWFIQKSLFKGNTAKLSGGAIYGIASGSYPFYAGADFVQTTFDGNVALKKPGGAFALDGGTSFSCCRCKFRRNTGARVVSNGYVRGTSNTISTTVGVTIPAVTVEPTAEVDFTTSAFCDLRQ